MSNLDVSDSKPLTKKDMGDLIEERIKPLLEEYHSRKGRTKFNKTPKTKKDNQV